ncbi:MAG TPA: PDZ domain-containing protein, partial [Planctomycetota bacterium]|nr:PDZ domain-containing protein [Planctomycetota bacterium]
VTLDPQGIARTTLAFAYREKTLVVTQDDRNLCEVPCTDPFDGAMAYQAGGDATLHFGEFAFRAGGEILFRDDFMRADTDGFWKPLQGAWELESITFPERSSNPFALKAVFTDRESAAEIDKNREAFHSDMMGGVGAGIQPDMHNGMITVARITGDGPAARAGLMEEDIILSLNKRKVTFRDMMFFFHQLRQAGGGPVDLEILRPGESQPRHIVFTPGEYKWADVRLHSRLPNSQLAAEALVSAGRDSWQSYHALCAVRFLAGGGAGMVLGQGRDGEIAVRWYGPNRANGGLKSNTFQVIQKVGGQEKMLFEKPLTPWRDTFYRLHVDTTGADLKVYVDEVLVCTLPGIKAPAGKIGLWACKSTLHDLSAADDGVFFDDVEVVTDPAKITAKAQLRINRIMKNEQDMKQWANPSHEWLATCLTPTPADPALNTAGTPVVQYRGDVPGHQGLLVKTPRPAAGRGFSLYLGLPLPAPVKGLVSPTSPATASAADRSLRAPATAAMPGWLEPLGTPLFFPPHVNDGGTPALSMEERLQRQEPLPSVGMATFAPLPPMRACALEWRWIRDGEKNWNWALIDPTKAAPLATGRFEGAPDALALFSTSVSAGAQGPQAARIVARINGQEVAALPREFVAPVGQSVGVSGIDNWPDDGVLEVSGDQVLEYSFTNAPDDWAVHAGRWGLLNKWVCDPRWSWFGGRSDNGLASIWNKLRFQGDIAVDYYAALMMYSNDPPYERPGDFNCTIFGDGVNQGSGYSLIFGGGDNRYSALTRNGRTVAWTMTEAARLPSDRLRQQEKMDLHQRWFHLHLRRVGNKVSYSLDGVQWLEFTDADPIAAGRVALWT